MYSVNGPISKYHYDRLRKLVIQNRIHGNSSIELQKNHNSKIIIEYISSILKIPKEDIIFAELIYYQSCRILIETKFKIDLILLKSTEV